VTGTHALVWDVMYNVSPGAFEWGWDKDGYLVVIDAHSGQVYTTTCTGELVYRYVIDVEVRRYGAVIRRKTITTTLMGMAALTGTPMPMTGQYDGDLPWEISLTDTGQFEVWEWGRWVPDCDELPTFTAYREGDGGLVPQDEHGFSLVGVYER